jgi:hypothetical protein
VAAYQPELWHDFATAFVGAAGALLGLAFVAISFNLDAILKDTTLPGRAIETLVCFAYPLAGGLLLLMPGLSNRSLGIGQAILAVGLAGMAVHDLPRWWKSERADPLSWRLTYLAPGVLISALAIIGAVASMTASVGGLYWVAAAMAVATGAGIINSWILLVEIKR